MTVTVFLSRKNYTPLILWQGADAWGRELFTKHRRSQNILQCFQTAQRHRRNSNFLTPVARITQTGHLNGYLTASIRQWKTWNSHCILFCDEGNEGKYTRLARKMAVYNPIPSQFGTWRDTGRMTRNIPTERILEDLFFKNSEKILFYPDGRFLCVCLAPTRKTSGVEEQIRPPQGIR